MGIADYFKRQKAPTGDEHLENVKKLLGEVKTIINTDTDVKPSRSLENRRLKYPKLLSEKIKVAPPAKPEEPKTGQKVIPTAVGKLSELRSKIIPPEDGRPLQASSKDVPKKTEDKEEIPIASSDTAAWSTTKEDGKIKRLKTGIPGFDMLLKDGIPEGSSVLVEGGPGSGKTIFCLQMANNACKKGLKTLYMSFEEPERRLREHMKRFGWNPEEFEKKGLLMVRRFNALDIARSVEALLSEAKRELLIDVQPVLIPKEFKPDIVCVDSLSSIASAFSGEESRFRIYMEQLFRYFESRNITAFLIRETVNPTHIGSVYSEKGEVVSFLSDGIIVLYNAIFSDRRRARAIEVLKMRGDDISRRIVLATIVDGKGFVVYPDEQVDGSYTLT